MTLRNPDAAQAGGYVLALAGVLVAVGLLFHPVPSGGFEERASVLANTPWCTTRSIACCLAMAGSPTTGSELPAVCV